MNKRKIINDPVYGFISIPNELAFDIIEHKYFQRLRYIKQLGLSELVYPGALHNRFIHSIGATHLMTQAINILRSKDHEITEKEEEGAQIAILLHDIGHGPFSHTLEYMLNSDISHEQLSELFMEKLNIEFNGKLDIAIEIFKDTYKKKFLHQLVSSQLDVDRLDYLTRDSFFTGVSEGIIGTNRIIKMLNVKDDILMVEEKGIYSIEKFIIARRLMYWQVYMHKTVLVAEKLLINCIKRARYLISKSKILFGSPELLKFLSHDYTIEDFKNDNNLLNEFANIDDNDVLSAIKVWCKSDDKVLALLSNALINRQLFRIELRTEKFDKDYIKEIENKIISNYNISKKELKYFTFYGKAVNNAYNPKMDEIHILKSNGECSNISKMAHQLNIGILSKTDTKYYLCYPKNLK